MTPRQDPRLVALVHLAENLSHRLPLARAHVRSQLNHIGDLRGTSYDRQPGGERTMRIDGDNVPVTGVEAAALQRTALTGRLEDIEADTKGIAMILSRILNDCDKIIGTTLPDTPRCNSTGRDGAIEWADPTCTAVPSRGPLCDRCAKREWRFRNARGLPPRTDGVFTGEAKAAS